MALVTRITALSRSPLLLSQRGLFALFLSLSLRGGE